MELKRFANDNRPEKVTWNTCAVAFYLEGVEEKLEGDIYFPPGKYMFNMHTMLEWETMTHMNDVWYIMSPEKRHYEGEELAHPAIWRDFPEGITVREISMNHEDGSTRPYFENRDEYVFICLVPDYITIDGNEFMWWG